MAKKKLQRFAEVKGFDNVIQPLYYEVYNKDHKFKGNWAKEFFKNNNPIIVELGCGKGEYTIGLAQKYPEKNFIGIDIKGERIWHGAKTAKLNNYKNVAFIRSKIEFIKSFFSENEICEIWLSFPDPQEKDGRSKKRLTSSRFLNLYKELLIPDGCINLKTDNLILYNYTNEIIKYNNLETIFTTNNLYINNHSDLVNLQSIKTFYENQYLKQSKNIYYIKFKINKNINIEEPEA